MKRVVIRDSEWYRNDVDIDYFNYSACMMIDDGSGRKCCLGIAASACGVEDNDMLNVGGPEGVEGLLENVCYSGWFDKGSRLIGNAIAVNDEQGTDDEAKIEALRPLFRDAGFQLVWRPDL